MNCLKDNQISSLVQLLGNSEADLLALDHFGRKSLNEIRDVLAEYNLSLKK
jgi:DNA-directed RNA polymerase subunit alpha